jgi:hypothetical protein
MSWGLSIGVIIIGLITWVRTNPIAAAKLAISIKRQWRAWLGRVYGTWAYKQIERGFRARAAREGTPPKIVAQALRLKREDIIRDVGDYWLNEQHPDTPSLIEKLL